MNFNFVPRAGKPGQSRIYNCKLTVTLKFLSKKGKEKRSVPNPFGHDCSLQKGTYILNQIKL